MHVQTWADVHAWDGRTDAPHGCLCMCVSLCTGSMNISGPQVAAAPAEVEQPAHPWPAAAAVPPLNQLINPLDAAQAWVQRSTPHLPQTQQLVQMYVYMYT